MIILTYEWTRLNDHYISLISNSSSYQNLIMKKIYALLTIVLLISFVQVNAQLEKGSMLVGGDISRFDLTLNSSKSFNVIIDPKAAWFIKDNLAVGAYLNFELATAKGAGTSTSYGVGALARYYVSKRDADIQKGLRLFVEGTAGIEGTNAAHGGGSTNGLGLGIGPGIAYFVSPNVSLEALVKVDGIVGFGSDVSTADIVFGIGFQIYLPGKKVNQIRKGKM